MNQLEETYEIIRKEKIEIIKFNFSSRPAGIVEDDYGMAILVDKSKISSSIEENIVLNEELGHYYCNAFYDKQSSPTLVAKMEYRAKKWQIQRLVPLHLLKQNKNKTIDDLAEQFNVTVKFMLDALKFYRERQLI